MFSFSKHLIASSAAGAAIGTPSRSLLISRVSNRKTRSPARSSYTKSLSGWPAISVISVSVILPIAGRSTWLHRNATDICVPLPGAESRMSAPPVCSAACAKSGIPKPVFFPFVVKKGSRTFASVSGSIPLPSSLISTRRRSCSASIERMISILFASAHIEFSTISRIWSDISCKTSADRLPAVPASKCLFDLGHTPVFDGEAGKALADILRTVGIRARYDGVVPAIREPLFRFVYSHLRRYFHSIEDQGMRYEAELADDAEGLSVHMCSDHQALAFCCTGRRHDCFGRERCRRDQKPVTETGHAVFVVCDHLESEGVLVISAIQMLVNIILESEKIIVIVEEHQDVRFFRRSDFHPAEHHQPVPLARLLDGQNVLCRVMIAHANQVETPLESRIYDFTRRHVKS